MLDEPLTGVEAKQLAARIISERRAVRFTSHAHEEMEKDRMDEQDVLDTLASGVVENIDYERGTWRYRFRVPQFTAVIGFRTENLLVVVTAWRNR